MKYWRPVDWIVLVLTIAVVFCVTAVVTANIICDREISENSEDKLTQLLIYVSSIISVYVGNKLRRPGEHGPDDPGGLRRGRQPKDKQ